MADTAPRLGKRMTLREFLDWEERQPGKFEFIGGFVRMMTGGTRDHSTIKSNIVSALKERLRGRPCRAFDSDVKVLSANGESHYPDATVDCGDGAGDLTHAIEPRIVFEVLSRSTRQSNLDEKLPSYQATPSIKEIVFVEPNRMHLMVWRRNADGWQEDEVVRPDEPLALESIGVSLTMTQIYEDVTFEG